MTYRKKNLLKTALILGVTLLVGALYKTKVISWASKVPGLSNIDKKVGEGAA